MSAALRPLRYATLRYATSCPVAWQHYLRMDVCSLTLNLKAATAYFRRPDCSFWSKLLPVKQPLPRAWPVLSATNSIAVQVLSFVRTI